MGASLHKYSERRLIVKNCQVKFISHGFRDEVRLDMAVVSAAEATDRLPEPLERVQGFAGEKKERPLNLYI